MFAHVLLCHLVLLKTQPTVFFFLLAIVFTTLLTYAFSVYQPTEREIIAFVVIYTAFATTLHPFSADVILSLWIATFFLVYEKETNGEETTSNEVEDAKQNERGNGL